MSKTAKSSERKPPIKKVSRGSAAASDSQVDETRDLDPKMLQLLVCPLTKHQLELDLKQNELKSKSARLAYPIRGGIPILLPSEARTLEDDEI